MEKRWRTSLSSLFLFLFLLGIGVFVNPQNVEAATYDNAVTFYNTHGDNMVFKDGYFYYANRGKSAGSSTSTTVWNVVGYKMKVQTSSKTTNLYFNKSSYMVELCSSINSSGYVYDLYRINLAHIKSKLSGSNQTAYNEFVTSGGTISIDSCMITVWIDKYGNRYPRGSMDGNGNFSGKVYTTYEGIANAAPWANPSSLKSYFNKSIRYETALLSRQVVYVRYQNASGGYGDYSAVINKDYVYGQTVSWSRNADTTYKAVSTSYTVTGAKTTHITVYRQTYNQVVYVRYQQSDGNYGNYSAVINKSYYNGANVSWSRSADSCYNAASVSYTVNGAKTTHISVSRKTYNQVVHVRYQQSDGSYGSYGAVVNKSYYYGANVSWSRKADSCYNAASISYTVTSAKTSHISVSRKTYSVGASSGIGISTVTGGGTYYYGATCTVRATVKTGYTWKNWSGTYSSANQSYSFTVSKATTLVANANANTYIVVLHGNNGTEEKVTLNCTYDTAYTLPAMTFTEPEKQATYVGWNTDSNAFTATYQEKQQIKNLTTTNGTTIHLYAIWDYAPELTCSNRYFTLYEAKQGVITEEELLRTVITEDREEITTEVRVKEYQANTFTSVTESVTKIITYTTTDREDNVVEKEVLVTIVDTNVTKEGEMDFDGILSYARFISGEYYLKPYASGGLEDTSLWRSDSQYSGIIQRAMSNQSAESSTYVSSYTFTKEDTNRVKTYVETHGLGNSRTERGLEQFMEMVR